MKKKLFLVKREVWATNIEKALKGRGCVYEVVETEDKTKDNLPPNHKSKKVGFK